MKLREKLKKFFTSLVAISMVATTVVPATTMAAEMPIIPDEYTVTLSQTDGGMLTFEGTEGNTAQFEEGDEVNINITPDAGYEFSKISIAYANDGEIAAEDNDEGVTSYSFEMPSADLTVSAEWKKTEVSEKTVSEISDEHTVSITQSEGGTLYFENGSTDNATFKEGETVIISIDNNTASPVVSINVETASGESVGVSFTDQYVFTFIMPNEDVNISLTYYGTTDKFAEYYAQIVEREKDLAYIPSLYASSQGYYQSGRWISYEELGIYSSSGSGDYGGTLLRTVDGNAAFCLQPSLDNIYPDPGYFNKIYDITPYMNYTGDDDISKQVERIREILYISPGAPGYDKYKDLWPSEWVDGTAITQDENVVNAHILLSHAFDTSSLSTAETFDHLSTAYQNYYRRYVLGSYDGNTYSDATWRRICAGEVSVPDSFVIFMISDGNSADQYILSYDYEPYGYLTLKKSAGSSSDIQNYSGNSNYSLANATYRVYTDSSCSTRAKDADGNNITLTTTSDGSTNTVELEQGTYYVKEYSASSGYDLDDNVYKVEVTADNTEDNPATVSSTEPPQYGYIEIQKSSNNTSMTDGNTCYTLEGAVYGIYTDSACTNLVQSLTTDSNGYAKSDKVALGTYYIKEESRPDGYYLDENTPVATVTVNASTSSSTNVATVNVSDTPINDPMGITLYKIDKETGEAWPQGDADLSGAQFTINFYDGYYSEDDIAGMEPTRTWVLQTIKDADGDYSAGFNTPNSLIESESDEVYKQDGIITLPLGTYTIQETGSPTGYLIEGDFYDYDGNLLCEAGEVFYTQLKDDGSGSGDGVWIYGGNEYTLAEQVERGGFEIQKRDVQTMLDTPEGSASFEGIEFKLINQSEDAVLVDTDGDGELEQYEPGEVIMHFTLDENGYYISPDDLLPYGSYTVSEVSIPLADGYLYGNGDFEDSYPDYSNYETDHPDAVAQSNISVDFTIREDGQIVNMTGVDDEYGESIVDVDGSIADLVKRGDLAFRKQDGEDQSTPEGPIEWTLTSATTGEVHHFWTDDNGDYSTDSTWNAHTYKTNAGEDETDGVWFYGYADANEYGTSDIGYDEDHYQVVDNSLGALPYDTYYLDEIEGEYNEGMEMIHTTVEVYRDMRVVDLGTIDNYPHDISTTATSAESGLHYLDADEHAVVNDAIEYEGLSAGEDYTFITMLYDLNTGDFVKVPADDKAEPDTAEPDDSEPADEEGETEASDNDTDIEAVLGISEETGSDYVYEVTTFTPSHRDGSKTVEFMFDATGLDGHTIVLYEYLFDANGNLVVAEQDPTDEDQMLYFPLIGTELTTNDGSHMAVANGEITLTDTVMYEGLPTNKNVTMKGTLYNKETQKAVATAETTWFNTEADGTVEIEFTFDASEFAGGAAVAAEEAYINGILVGHHFDWDDEDQTVSFPSVGTTMVNNWTGEHQATVFENHNIDFTDTVAYSGLDTTKQYVVIGYLMDPETQEVVVDANGLEVTSQSEVFTPETPDGEIQVHFDFFAFGLHDTYTVAFEYLYEVDENNVGTLIAQHTDYDDAGQTVQLMKPTLWTDASITGTDSNQTDATDEVDITDMLDITGLIVGHTYYVYGKAVHEDGTPVLDATTGEPVELYNMFVADAEEMELDIMNFVFDATGLDGQAVIFEEYMYADEDRTILITEEEDLGAYEQTIFFNSAPVIKTTLKDTETGTHEAAATSKVSLTDEIEYEGLTIGKTYTATGYLMNKETGEKLLDANGNEITASSSPFTAETPSGTVEVTFTFDASGLSGTHAVAFEQLYDVEGNLIAVHEDIDDEDQTVLLTNLSIGTTLLDEYTGSHNAYISRNGKTVVSLVDTIVYDGLTKGEEYTVSGVLMNKETGEKVVDADGEEITSFATFKADGESGSVEVVFEFDASALSGITVVAYEYLYGKDGDTAIASHEDLNDENQAVLLNGPIIGTNAAESSTGSKTVLAGQVSITDTVDYTGLVEDETYTLVGYAVNPDTGEAIKDAGGNIVTNNMSFKAGASSGQVDVVFPFDASNLAGQTIVFVEYLYYGQSTDNDDLIAWHFDLSDEAQSINISSPQTEIITTGTPTEITTTPVETTTTTTEMSSPTTKRTADMRYVWILVAVAGCASVVAVVGSRRRAKVRK